MEREQLNVLWDGMKHTLNQMQRSQYATTQSKAYGYGGAVVVHQITGLALNTITRGKKELLYPVESKPRRVREIGGGPKWTEENYPDIQEHLRLIVEDNTTPSILLYQQELARETAIRLIGSTITSTGLKVICCRDDRVYKTAQSVSDDEYASIPLTRIAPRASAYKLC